MSGPDSIIIDHDTTIASDVYVKRNNAFMRRLENIYLYSPNSVIQWHLSVVGGLSC